MDGGFQLTDERISGLLATISVFVICKLVFYHNSLSKILVRRVIPEAFKLLLIQFQPLKNVLQPLGSLF